MVVVGADSDINGFSWQLEKALPVPVFAQTMAQVTIARGAALAAARSTEFTDEQLVAHVSEPAAEPARPRKLSYAGAVTASAAGAITFVASVSLAVGIQLAPRPAARPRSTWCTHRRPRSPKPSLPPLHRPRETEPPAPPSKAPAGEPVAESGAPDKQQGAPARAATGPERRQPYLTRVLEHIPGDAGDSAAPHAPTP